MQYTSMLLGLAAARPCCCIASPLSTDALSCFCLRPCHREVGPGDVAFLLHTSGTTSRPKLVPLTHGAIATNLAGLKQTYHLTSADTGVWSPSAGGCSCVISQGRANGRQQGTTATGCPTNCYHAGAVAHMLPLFHVAGIVIGLLSTLVTGGCVVLAPTFDPLTFPALLREHRVTWFTAVPTIFKGLLDHRTLFPQQVRAPGHAALPCPAPPCSGPAPHCSAPPRPGPLRSALAGSESTLNICLKCRWGLCFGLSCRVGCLLHHAMQPTTSAGRRRHLAALHTLRRCCLRPC